MTRFKASFRLVLLCAGQGACGVFNRIISGNIGLYGDNGKENGNYRDYRIYIGIILGGPSQDRALKRARHT